MKLFIIGSLLFSGGTAVAMQDENIREIPCALLGDYQIANKKTVLCALQLLSDEFVYSQNHVESGFLNVIYNTGLLGRWQVLNASPKVVCDTAHNSHGLKVVLNQIKKEQFDNLHIVLGVVNDKELDSILPLFPKNAKYYFCSPNVSRALNSSILMEQGMKIGLKGKLYSSVSAAYESALKSSKKADFIYIGGSTFVVAEII